MTLCYLTHVSLDREWLAFTDAMRDQFPLSGCAVYSNNNDDYVTCYFFF